MKFANKAFERVSWDEALNSKLDLMPKNLAFGDLPRPKVAVPGEDPLI